MYKMIGNILQKTLWTEIELIVLHWIKKKKKKSFDMYIVHF